MYNEKYLKAKTKSFNGKINNNNNNKIHKRGFSIYLFISNFDSVFRTGKNYYPQVFVKECEYDVSTQEA